MNHDEDIGRTVGMQVRCSRCGKLVNLFDMAPGYTCGPCHQVELSALRQSTRWSFVIFVIAVLMFLYVRRTYGAVSEEFLDQVAWKESRNNPHAVGRAGELGAFQLKPIAIRDVNKEFGWRLRSTDAVSRGRFVARAFFAVLARRMGGYLGRQPTNDELYDCYSHGFAAWKRHSVRAGATVPLFRRGETGGRGSGSDFAELVCMGSSLSGRKGARPVDAVTRVPFATQ